MKKNSLIKGIIGIFVAYVILSWIIPTGTFSNGSLTTSGTAPIGLIDLLRYPVVAFSTSVFTLMALVILCIGGFYAVLNKTGVYAKLVNTIASKFKGNEKRFLIISILVFGILTSLTALNLPLFVLVPLFVAIIMTLGFSKIVALLSTIGAILVGNIGSTYGFNINGYVTYFLGTNINETVLYRIILFVLLIALLIFTVLKMASKEVVKTKKTKTTKKSTKKDTKEEKKEEKKIAIPLFDNDVDEKKSIVPMVIIIACLMIVSLVSMYNWTNALNVTFFEDIYESITTFEINGFPIFKNLLGSVDPFGYWSNYELCTLLVFASLLIGWIYNVKLTSMVKSFADGAKKMFKVAVYVVLANIIFLLMNSTSTGANMFATVANWFFELTKNFNILTMGLTSVVGGLFFNDFPYMLNTIYSQISSLYESALPVIGLVLQGIHGLIMLVVPTSTILVAGLTYLDIPYTEYLKNIWKYLLMALVAVIIIIAAAAIIIL